MISLPTNHALLRQLVPGHADSFLRPFGSSSLSLAFDAAAKKKRRKGPPTLGRVVPNSAIELRYRRALDVLVAAMCEEVQEAVIKTYEDHEPEMVLAEDARPTPASRLSRVVSQMAKKWQERFDEASEEMADYFADDVEERSSRALRKLLRDGGISVRFQMTKAMRDVVDATTAENVGLIKSIPQKYLGDVEGMVMRSVTLGRDLGSLSDELREKYGITKRRAALIARDQNNKATASMIRVRQVEIGVEKAVWHHSTAGKEPRPTHVKMSGRTYDVKKGMWDPAVGKHIFPGELINCRCTSSSVIPGFE